MAEPEEQEETAPAPLAPHATEGDAAEKSTMLASALGLAEGEKQNGEGEATEHAAVADVNHDGEGVSETPKEPVAEAVEEPEPEPETAPGGFAATSSEDASAEPSAPAPEEEGGGGGGSRSGARRHLPLDRGRHLAPGPDRCPGAGGGGRYSDPRGTTCRAACR